MVSHQSTRNTIEVEAVVKAVGNDATQDVVITPSTAIKVAMLQEAVATVFRRLMQSVHGSVFKFKGWAYFDTASNSYIFNGPAQITFIDEEELEIGNFKFDVEMTL